MAAGLFVWRFLSIRRGEALTLTFRADQGICLGEKMRTGDIDYGIVYSNLQEGIKETASSCIGNFFQQMWHVQDDSFLLKRLSPLENDILTAELEVFLHRHDNCY